MGVYIKCMEMPRDGVYLCEIGVAGDIATLTIHGGITEERKAYPFIAVPDHGDLIDRDTIVDSVCEGVCRCSECSFSQYPFDSCVLQTNLGKLKTVIQAERSEA